MAPIAQKIVEEEGATERIKVVAADVLSGPLAGSYDVAVLRAFLQVLSPQDARLAIKHNRCGSESRRQDIHHWSDS